MGMVSDGGGFVWGEMKYENYICMFVKWIIVAHGNHRKTTEVCSQAPLQEPVHDMSVS